MPCCPRRSSTVKVESAELYCEVPNSLITLEPLKKEQQSIFLLQGKTMFESQNLLMNKKIPALKNTTHLFFHVQNLILKSHTHTQPSSIKNPNPLCLHFKFLPSNTQQFRKERGGWGGWWGRGNIASPSLMRILCDCKHKDQILIILVDY